MVNILFFIDTLSGGGAEKVLQNLVNHLDQTQFRITVHTLQECDPVPYLVPGIRYKAINCCKTALGRKLFSYWIRFCAEVGLLYPLYIRDDYDIEVAYLECGPTKFLSRSTNRSALKLAWVHCDFEKRNFRATRKQKAIYASYDKVVCVSDRVKESFLHLFGAPPAIVLHNVIDENEIMAKAGNPANPNKFTFLCVGRLSHEKGIDRLLDACCRLKEDHLDFHLQILGDGPQRTKLESQIQALGLENQVSLLGFRDNPYPYMKAADCIVCASRYEGFSTVVTEALILGKPVVTTPCSGMDELLGDSEFGLITEDSVDGIYLGMKRMLEDAELKNHYAEAAAYRGRNFSKAATVKATEQFLLAELSSK